MRRQLFAEVSDEEYAIVRQMADQEGTTVSNFLRRCINGALLEQGDDMPLLREREQGRVRT